VLHGILAKAIWEEETKLSMSFPEQVERALHQLVLSGTATADSISNLFGICGGLMATDTAVKGQT